MGEHSGHRGVACVVFEVDGLYRVEMADYRRGGDGRFEKLEGFIATWPL